MTNGSKKMFKVPLATGIHKRLKVHAAQQSTTATALIQQFIELGLAEADSRAKKEKRN